MLDKRKKGYNERHDVCNLRGAITLILFTIKLSQFTFSIFCTSSFLKQFNRFNPTEKKEIIKYICPGSSFVNSFSITVARSTWQHYYIKHRFGKLKSGFYRYFESNLIRVI